MPLFHSELTLLGLVLSQGYFHHITEVGGGGGGCTLDLASSMELKSVVSSPNKRKKLEKFSYHKGKKSPGKKILLLYGTQSKKIGYLSSIFLEAKSEAQVCRK